MPQPQRNDAWSGVGIGWSITATMAGGVAAWGGLGYLADRLLLGTAGVFTALGVVIGAGAATYIVYLRYGKREERPDGA